MQAQKCIDGSVVNAFRKKPFKPFPDDRSTGQRREEQPDDKNDVGVGVGVDVRGPEASKNGSAGGREETFFDFAKSLRGRDRHQDQVQDEVRFIGKFGMFKSSAMCAITNYRRLYQAVKGSRCSTS